MVIAYWEIGKRLVEEEQQGNKKADYGKNLLSRLAKSLSRDFGKSFDARELEAYKAVLFMFFNSGHSASRIELVTLSLINSY